MRIYGNAMRREERLLYDCGRNHFRCGYVERTLYADNRFYHMGWTDELNRSSR